MQPTSFFTEGWVVGGDWLTCLSREEASSKARRPLRLKATPQFRQQQAKLSRNINHKYIKSLGYNYLERDPEAKVAQHIRRDHSHDNNKYSKFKWDTFFSKGNFFPQVSICWPFLSCNISQWLHAFLQSFKWLSLKRAT